MGFLVLGFGTVVKRENFFLGFRKGDGLLRELKDRGFFGDFRYALLMLSRKF